MRPISFRFSSFLNSFNDVARLCFGMAAIGITSGAALELASEVVPVGSRGTGCLFVGGFYLLNGVVEIIKQQWTGTGDNHGEPAGAGVELSREPDKRFLDWEGQAAA